MIPHSNTYGSPMKLFEYMAAGRTVLAPWLPPIVSVIGHDDGGVLFPPLDRAGLTRALDGVLGDEPRRLQLGACARKSHGRLCVAPSAETILQISRAGSRPNEQRAADAEENIRPPALPPVGGALRKSAAEKLLPPSVLVTRGAANRRGVALTFDDGPDAMTREYLDALDQLGVVATFFVLGERCRQARDDAVGDGAAAATRSASHGSTATAVFPTSDSRRELRRELSRTAAELPLSPGGRCAGAVPL